MNYFESIEIDYPVLHEGKHYIVAVEYFFATEGVFDDGDDECPPSNPEIHWGKAECVSIFEKSEKVFQRTNSVCRSIPEEDWNKDVVSLVMQFEPPENEVLYDLYERRCQPNGDE